MDDAVRKTLGVAGVTALLLGVVGGSILVASLGGRVASEPRPFDTDEAAHAGPGLELYVALKRRDPAHLYRATVHQSFYPPLHSFVILASYAISGPSLAASRMPSVVMFGILLAALPLLILSVARDTTPADGAHPYWALLPTAALGLWLALSCPVLVYSSVLCMLELPGCLLVVATLLVCHRLDQRRHNRLGWLVLLGVVLLSLTLVKYSFGLIVTAGVLAALLIGRSPAALTHRGWKDAATVLVVVATGLAIWFVPATFSEAVRFLTVQPRYAAFWSVENLLFYPRAWYGALAVTPIAGIASGLLAIYAGVKASHRLAPRAALWIGVSALLALTLSGNNQPRHFLVVAPAIWLLSGLGAFLVLSRLPFRPSWLQRLTALTSCLLFVAVWSAALIRTPGLPAQLTRVFESEPTYADMQEFIVHRVDVRRPVLMLGLFDQFNVQALRWLAAVETDCALTEVRFDDYWHARARAGSRQTHVTAIETTDLRELLDTGAYDFVVELGKTGDPEHLADREALGPRRARRLHRTFGEWWVTIIDLRSST